MQKIFSLESRNQNVFDALQSKLKVSKLNSIETTAKKEILIPGHKRAIYHGLQGDGYIKQKGLGTHHLIKDSSHIESSNRHLNNSQALIYFIMNEGKIPFQMTRVEFESEVNSALDFIIDYLKTFNEFPNIPIPLKEELVSPENKKVIFQSFDYIQDKVVKEKLLKLFETSELCISYFYESNISYRLMDFLNNDKNTFIFCNQDTIDSLVEKWAQLFSRLLSLGYIPATKWSMNTGNCVSMQNLTLSGGMADLDSIVNVKEIKTESLKFESIIFSFDQFFRSIFTTLECFTNNSSEKNERSTAIKIYLWNKVKANIKDDQAQYQINLDQVIKDLFFDENFSIRSLYSLKA